MKIKNDLTIIFLTASNIYFALLRGAKAATTPYIWVAEDDTLYPSKHFHCFRPPLDTFAYNYNRLGIFTWGKAKDIVKKFR